MEWFLHIIKGMMMGIANIIPGVSGGTIAVVLGIYEKLTESIGSLFKKDGKRADYIVFLSQIGIGLFLGIILFSRIIEYFYQNYLVQTSYFFLGLILSSIPFIIKSSNNMKIDAKKTIVFLIGFSLVIIMILFNDKSGLEVGTGIIYNYELFYSLKLFLCGLLAATAMILPGMSGSFLLIVMGEYVNILGFVNRREIIPVLIVMLGAGLGILAFANIINYLLNTYRSFMMYFILGLIFASLFEIFPGINFGFILIFNLFLLVIGFYLGSIMGHMEK